MKYLFHVTIIVIILFFTPSTSSQTRTATPKLCPKVEDISPCICNEEVLDISCSGFQFFNLTTIFNRISADQDIVNTRFRTLIINDGIQMSELPAFTTGQVSFDIIHIHFNYPSKLAKIHYLAFFSSSKTAKQLLIHASDIKSQSTDYSLIKLVNEFDNLSEIDFWTQIDELEDEAFNKNNNLKWIHLRVNSISGSPFAKLSNLTNLELDNGKLNYLPSKAFYFHDHSTPKYITLSNNKLKSISFETSVFNHLIDTKLSLESNQITYLEKSIFMPFFEAHTDNQLDLNGNPLDCNDCRMYWIFEAKEELNLMAKIKYAYCDGNERNGTIWEHEESFHDCKSQNIVSQSISPKIISPQNIESNNIESQNVKSQNVESQNDESQNNASHNLCSIFLVIIFLLASKII